MDFRKYLPKIFKWTTPEEKYIKLQEEYVKLIDNFLELNNINRGLNMALGELVKQNDELRNEATALLAAITLQHGGGFVIKAEFFETLMTQSATKLNIKRDEDKNIYMSLEVIAEEEPIDEQEESCEDC